jgi:DNA-binding NarL/FixJ family response regulator
MQSLPFIAVFAFCERSCDGSCWNLAHTNSGRAEFLSDREMEVLVLIGSGKQASDIAEELNISVKTVSTYRSRILSKLNMETSAQIIRYSLQHGLLG